MTDVKAAAAALRARMVAAVAGHPMKLSSLASSLGFVLSSGREIYANRGLLSINEDGDVHEGYDGEIENAEPVDPADVELYGCDPQLTQAERAEIADYVCALWRAWAEPRS